MEIERRIIAFTGDDLIAIGRIVNRMTKRLKAFEADEPSDVSPHVFDLRVEVFYEEEVVGYVGFEDGWLGFRPYPIDSPWHNEIWKNEKKENN